MRESRRAPSDDEIFGRSCEPHRRELELHCYRMLGSLEEARELVQETFLRAYRGRDRLREHGSLRAWLYKIATRACLDARRARRRRVLPPARFAPADPTVAVGAPALDVPWLEPCPDAWLGAAPGDDPESALARRQGIALAFIAALQQLPARQRAALLATEVLGLSARDAAELLDTTVAALNSALQRARVALPVARPRAVSLDAEEHALLARYIEAWQDDDLDALRELLRDDAVMSMPPNVEWYRGRDAILDFVGAQWAQAPRQFRLAPTRANGAPGALVYRRAPGQTEYAPLAIKVLRVADGRVAEITGFVMPALFVHFAAP